MSYFSSLVAAMDYPAANSNLNNIHRHHPHLDRNIDPFPVEFQLSDYIMLDGDDDDFHQGFDGFTGNSTTSSQSVVSSEYVASDNSTGLYTAGSATSTRNININKSKRGMKKDNSEVGQRVAFRTISELEIMDDGFKWRKYGKKSVKNSPNPRNYYKCSSGGCNVKKRVERDREDSRYVVTTYDGVHNHESPCMVYYNQRPLDLMLPNNAWTQASSTHSSSSS